MLKCIGNKLTKTEIALFLLLCKRSKETSGASTWSQHEGQSKRCFERNNYIQPFTQYSKLLKESLNSDTCENRTMITMIQYVQVRVHTFFFPTFCWSLIFGSSVQLNKRSGASTGCTGDTLEVGLSLSLESLAGRPALIEEHGSVNTL